MAIIIGVTRFAASQLPVRYRGPRYDNGDIVTATRGEMVRLYG